ncbi:hypothetical protein EVAR_84972_1 [Eumeta japonica]|uniref:Uncharacterized protein n=1 Tax=Eumeta variegata TaxID=151549 RepID=A0A4C1VJ93_EUMVA|nr:hypothetical protein EVAR_84972_1 [Eumeta japonica]
MLLRRGEWGCYEAWRKEETVCIFLSHSFPASSYAFLHLCLLPVVFSVTYGLKSQRFYRSFTLKLLLIFACDYRSSLVWRVPSYSVRQLYNAKRQRNENVEIIKVNPPGRDMKTIRRRLGSVRFNNARGNISCAEVAAAAVAGRGRAGRDYGTCYVPRRDIGVRPLRVLVTANTALVYQNEGFFLSFYRKELKISYSRLYSKTGFRQQLYRGWRLRTTSFAFLYDYLR